MRGDPHRVFCGACGGEIEYCDGRFGGWMHTDGRLERAPDGHLAEPQLPAQVA